MGAKITRNVVRMFRQAQVQGMDVVIMFDVCLIRVWGMIVVVAVLF
jgi:hypothetical protein